MEKSNIVYIGGMSATIAIAVLLVCFIPAALATSTTISVQDASADVGTTTTALITVHDVTDLGGFGITLSYDPAVVNVTGATNNANLPDDWGISDFSTAATGSVVLASSGLTLPSLNGDVVLTTITLEAVGSAGQTSPLDIISIGLVDSGGNDISAGVTAVNGTFSITETTPPAIEFIAPTPANNTEVNVNYVNVTVRITDPSGVSVAILNWNGMNNTMWIITPNIRSLNKTDLSSGNYAFKVYANDTVGNMGISETRIVTVNVTGLPKTGNIDGVNGVNMADALYLVNYIYHVPGFEELYPGEP